ncbi:Ig-like domain repeat protein [Streptomyces sp. NPDC001914]|uniref:Ig-like domain repeat protein n=1 Tax=Streptomyces sp. NPDC001914 TaxID=3364623 RepID=UPI0036C71378
MRTRSVATATALAVLAGSAVLMAVPAVPAAAAGTAVVITPGGIVADGALHRVFAGDQARGRIVAGDYSGALVDSVDGVGAVVDLTLSADGATLYAALPDSHQILALDAATLDIEARYDVAAAEGPRHLAFAGGRVWFGYDDPQGGGLGSVDPAGGTDAVTLGQLPGGLGTFGDLVLDSDPGKPDTLAFAATGLDASGGMGVLDVSGTSPRLVAHDNSQVSGAGDVDLVPGAPEVLINMMNRYAYADGKLSDAGSYAYGGWSGDVSPSGLLAKSDDSYVTVYRPGADTPTVSHRVSYNGLGGTTWAPDSSRLFVLKGTDGDGYFLTAITDPVRNVPALKVYAPSTATRAHQLTVNGELRMSWMPTDTKLQVTRTDLESPSGKTLPDVTVNPDGTFSFSDTPPAGGTVTYKVSYAGDADRSAVSVSAKVAVSLASTSLSLNNDGKVYAYGTDVSFTAHLGTTYKNRTVEIWANPYGGDKPNKLVKTGTVNSGGNISATIDMTRDTAVTAVFKGDARFKARTVTSTGYAQVKNSTVVSKHYKTAKIGSTSYYWFHKSTDPLLTTTMTYYPGRMQQVALQVYRAGAWRTADNSPQYFKLGTNGRSAVTLKSPGTSGVKVRIRSSYINEHSGDTVNSTTYGSWKYLYFSN